VFSTVSVLVIRVTQATYRLAGEGSPSVYVSSESNKILDSYSSVPSRGELLSSEKLRLSSLGSVARGKATLVLFRGRRLSIFYRLLGTKPAPLYPLRILSIFIAFTQA
jgi:hypothetical protein